MNIYEAAALIFKDFEKLRSSPKTLVYNSDYSDKHTLLPLVTKLIDYREDIKKCIEELNLDLGVKKHLATVLVYEVAYGRNFGRHAVYRRMIRPYHSKIRTWFRDNGTTRPKKIIERASGPTYARVNTLLTTLENVTATLSSEGWTQLSIEADCSYEKYLDTVRGLSDHTYVLDMHVPNLLVAPRGRYWYECSMYKKGELIFQDKASCLPALALNPGPADVVLDCCAAPGNKSSQLAELVGPQGSLTAVEIYKNRAKTLRTLLEQRGATHVRCLTQDIFEVDPSEHELEAVTHVLLDPTCSGSGTSGEPCSEERVTQLASLQRLMLLHVLNTFPHIQRLVYSTCSTNAQENELTVKSVLAKFGDRFELEPVLPWWPRRGDASYLPGADACLRADPKRDLTHGFFVACLKRRPLIDTPVGQPNTNSVDTTLTTPEMSVNGDATDCERSKNSDKRTKSKRKKLTMDSVCDTKALPKMEQTNDLPTERQIKQKKKRKTEGAPCDSHAERKKKKKNIDTSIENDVEKNKIHDSSTERRAERKKKKTKVDENETSSAGESTCAVESPTERKKKKKIKPVSFEAQVERKKKSSDLSTKLKKNTKDALCETQTEEKKNRIKDVSCEGQVKRKKKKKSNEVACESPAEQNKAVDAVSKNERKKKVVVPCESDQQEREATDVTRVERKRKKNTDAVAVDVGRNKDTDTNSEGKRKRKSVLSPFEGEVKPKKKKKTSTKHL